MTLGTAIVVCVTILLAYGWYECRQLRLQKIAMEANMTRLTRPQLVVQRLSQSPRLAEAVSILVFGIMVAGMIALNALGWNRLVTFSLFVFLWFVIGLIIGIVRRGLPPRGGESGDGG